MNASDPQDRATRAARTTTFIPRDKGQLDVIARDPRVIDMTLLVSTLPWPTRVISWFLWRCWLLAPVKWVLLRAGFVNPYAQIVAIIVPDPAPRAKGSLDERKPNP